MRIQTMAAIGAALIAVSASAQAEEEETVDPRIGEEVSRICFGASINGWRAVDDTDNAVLLQRGVNDWYYVELLGACSHRVLRFAQQIGIESRPAGGCIRRGDIIIVQDTPGIPRRCSVRDMYKWDDDAETPEEDDEDSGNE